MNRFFIPKIDLKEDYLIFNNPDQVRQIGRVLRLKSGEQVSVFDGSGKEIILEITEVVKNSIIAKKISESWPDRELGIRINLFQAIISRDKFEMIVQKATELGVAKIIPIKTARSQPFSLNYERLRKIISEAAEQSGRVKLPQIITAIDLDRALHEVKSGFVAWENGKENSLKDVLDNGIMTKDREFNLFIGPEGGFTEEEIRKAKKARLVTFTLGKRILRAETAAIAAISLLACRL